MKYIFLSLLLLFSCGDDKDDEGLASVRYNGYMPNYSVNLPENALESKFNGSVFQRGFLNSLSSDENEIVIDCSTELNNVGKAPRFPNSPTQLTAICTLNNPDCIDNDLGLLIYAYANGLFYDCNVRQQVRGDGLSRLCKLRRGTSGDIASDDLCDEDDPSTQKMLAYSFSTKEGRT